MSPVTVTVGVNRDTQAVSVTLGLLSNFEYPGGASQPDL